MAISTHSSLRGLKDVAGPKRRRKSYGRQKRQRLRDQLWPDSEDLLWDRHSNQGFTTMPRLLALITSLIRDLGGKSDPSRVYLDLWFRAFDDAFLNDIDEERFSFSSGYKGNRAARSWRERVMQLKDLGFVDVKASGNTQIAYILILNPLHAVAKLRAAGKVKDDWWNAYLERANEIGAVLPTTTAKPKPKPKLPLKVKTIAKVQV